MLCSLTVNQHYWWLHSWDWSTSANLNLMNRFDDKTLENNTPGETLNGHSAAFCCILLHFSGTKSSHVLFTNAFSDWQLNCMYFLKWKRGRGQYFPSSFSTGLMKTLSRANGWHYSTREEWKCWAHGEQSCPARLSWQE